MHVKSTQIESYLREVGTWVAGEILCAAFQVSPRELRFSGGKPGLCSDFAISGPNGFCHILCCTELEWQAFSERMRGHAIAELTRVSRLRKQRKLSVTKS